MERDHGLERSDCRVGVEGGRGEAGNRSEAPWRCAEMGAKVDQLGSLTPRTFPTT